MERGSSWKTSGRQVKISGTRTSQRQRGLTVQCCTSSSTSSLEEEVELDGKNGQLDGKNGLDENYEIGKGLFGNLVTEYGWQVRRMIEKEAEMRKVAQVQAEAFHEPVVFFNDLFFQFFQAEVLSGLLYRLRNSPPDRYACLVAEPASGSPQEPRQELVGVVDVTVLRDEAVLQHLLGIYTLFENR
ncbi:hypothetical protein RJ640_016760 [Escallonia rubra]|uniref:Uncharacterized protein n=1 Tax=Escallonia rubra TaxID=112253 RepID=A0AA88QY85_9ASTE|nr:hypothetical protein RJ640_016760 [Escallonia rubra]